jgi:vacuolar protein sorting-associated protein VTA1
MKALREGRVPTAGPPGEEQQSPDLNENSGIPPSISEFPSPPSNFTAPLPPSSPQQPKESTGTPKFNPPPVPSPSISKPTTPAPVVVHHNVAPVTPTSTVNETQVATAQKYSKWAISALDYDDIKTARLQLLSALNELGYNQDNNFGYE